MPRFPSGSMVKEGYYFGLPPLALGGVAFLAHWVAAGIVLVCLAAFVFCFFRDPEREIPSEAAAVVSPADGRVVVVTEEETGGRPGKRISIFLAIWNVHVNRAPAEGIIRKLEYRPGKFLAAMRERASVENEQNVITLSVARGERIGLVRFGSRVDLWMPKEAEIMVSLGENVRGGSSVVARWPGKAAAKVSEGRRTAGADSHLAAAGKRA